MTKIFIIGERGADLVLLQNGVYFAQEDALGPFAGGVYVPDDDRVAGMF